MIGRVISFISGSGGTGKTVASSSIGAALAIKGHRVVLIDTCIGLRNLDVAIGLENREVFDVVDLLKNRSNLRTTLISHPTIEKLYIIPASQTDTEDKVDFANFKNIVNELRNGFDFILIDTPAGMGKIFKVVVRASDEVYVLTTSTVNSVRSSDRVIGKIEEYIKAPKIKLIVNSVMPELVKFGDTLSHQDIYDLLSIEILGLERIPR